MRVEGSHLFAAPREQVYALMTDPAALRACTPGCQSLEQAGEDAYTAVLSIGVAAIKGTYSGKLQLVDKQPPDHYKLLIEGSGSPGFVGGSATFDFKQAAGGTSVAYLWDVQVGGLVAGVGQRILGGVGKMLIGQFMTCMEKRLSS